MLILSKSSLASATGKSLNIAHSLHWARKSAVDEFWLKTWAISLLMAYFLLKLHGQSELCCSECIKVLNALRILDITALCWRAILPLLSPAEPCYRWQNCNLLISTIKWQIIYQKPTSILIKSYQWHNRNFKSPSVWHATEIFSSTERRPLSLHFQEEKQKSFPSAYRLTEILFLNSF